MLTTPTTDDALRSQDLNARTAALNKQFDSESTSAEQKQYRELAMMYLNHGMWWFVSMSAIPSSSAGIEISFDSYFCRVHRSWRSPARLLLVLHSPSHTPTVCCLASAASVRRVLTTRVARVFCAVQR